METTYVIEKIRFGDNEDLGLWDYTLGIIEDGKKRIIKNGLLDGDLAIKLSEQEDFENSVVIPSNNPRISLASPNPPKVIMTQYGTIDDIKLEQIVSLAIHYYRKNYLQEGK